jgi:hypothetical protein
VFGELLTKTEAKLEARCDLLLIETAVVDEQVPVAIIARHDLSAVVTCLLGDGVRQLAAWGGDTVEDVDETVTGFLAYSSLDMLPDQLL